VTATAFLHFQQTKCDVIVLECGLGGRLDSTNVIQDPLVSIITSIQYDHMGILGSTLEEIAMEKAGIMKAGSDVIIGPDCPVRLLQVSQSLNQLTRPLYHNLLISLGWVDRRRQLELDHHSMLFR
jgi:folylpolyglutamate synthase/dihydropteroate synthase